MKGAGLVAKGDHELLVKVAVGGTSTVFVGRERGRSELVAIKRMHPYLASDLGARKQMLREASIAGRVHHDHLVSIHRAKESEDELLLVMDYVEGGSLAELLAATALPLEVSLRIVLDAASGLAALHEVTDPDSGARLGFVHRDISPQNILVGVDGRTRLGDFGLVKRTDVSTTHTTVVRGKVAYMAPELVEGKPASQAADIYALGVVLWEAIGGDRLFRGQNDADTMRRVLVGEVPSLTALAPACPSAVERVVERCLRRDPGQRFASVPALVTALREAAPEVALASDQVVAALVSEALGQALARRRQTIAATANAEVTATGEIDVDALIASGRAMTGEGMTQPLPARGTFVETDTTPFEDALTASEPPSRPSTPVPDRRRFGTAAIALLAALGGASVSWLVARCADDSPRANPTPTAASAEAAPAPSSVEAPAERRRRTDPPAMAASASASGSSSSAVEARRPIARPALRPALRPAARPAGKTTATPDGDDAEVVVPDNPYR